MIPHQRLFLLLTIALFFLLSACTSAPAPRGVGGQPLQLITTLAPAGVFAGSPDRQLVAYGKAGLQLLDLATGERRQLDQGEPLAVGWRHDGERLAAAFADDQLPGRLVIFDRSGRSVEQLELPGAAVALAWSQRHELLVAGFRLQQYSFGGNLAQWLVRIAGQTREQFELGDATLKPTTAKLLKDQFANLLKVSFSPEGDELVVLQLHDPPQFPSYLQLTHRNWQGAGGRKLLDLPVQPVALGWGEDAETIVYHPAGAPWRVVPLWTTADNSQPVPEATSDLPDEWDAGTRWQRFADGHYLLATAGRLYAGSGLPVRLLPVDAERAWTLRKWRFDGLISPEEYQEVRP